VSPNVNMFVNFNLCLMLDEGVGLGVMRDGEGCFDWEIVCRHRFGKTLQLN